MQASTFHAAARRQLAYYWPLVHDQELPEVLDSKLAILIPLARQLPGGYKFTPAKDLADEIEWAKVRRQRPESYQPEREPPVPKDVFTNLWRRYEAAKVRSNRIDFEDMLTLAVELYESDEDAIGLVRKRYAWFSVDEYQDTNRLQEDLLRLWLGDRRDLCVVGDPDQTIYSFTGASSDHLTTFADRYADARVVRLSQNYRSTPQVIELANRLIPGRELRSAVGADGPRPELVAHADADAELAAIVTRIQALLAEGVDATEIAILVRTNAQLVPFEAALTGAGIPFTVRGMRFFARPDVRAARAALKTDATGRLSRIVATRWRAELGFDEAAPSGPGAEARDRHAALGTLLAIARSLEADLPDATVADFQAELARRDAAEADAAGEGRHAVDPPPRQGARVGRRLPAPARGGHAADPPVGVRPGRAGRGATASLRRDHAGAAPPRPVVGGEPGRCQGIGGPGAPVTVHRRAAAERRGPSAGTRGAAGSDPDRRAHRCG